jgi:APA family basic amino acid/polyamine antiporter
LAFNHLVAGLITVAAALSYGELAGMMPKAGGQFVYIQRAYGRLVSFYGWTVLPLFRLELLLQLQLRLQTILRYSFGIRYYTFFRLGVCFPTSKLLAIASIITHVHQY